MKIITHSGRFHADEVFSCAVISLLNLGDIEIIRSRNPELCEAGDFVVDVCGAYDPDKNHFDHHQEGGAGARPNGIPYSSFGLVWKKYGEKVSGSAAVAQALDEVLVQPIDAGDNGVETFSVDNDTVPYLIQNVIGIFAPVWNESRTDDEGFLEALEIAKRILARAILHAQGIEEGKRLAEDAYVHAEDKRIVVLNEQYPWHETLFAHPETLYAVVPDRGEAGNWKIEAVKEIPHTFQYRKKMPIAWAGKQNKELAEITGVADAVFCHNHRFIAVAGSKEGALALAKLAVEA